MLLHFVLIFIVYMHIHNEGCYQVSLVGRGGKVTLTEKGNIHGEDPPNWPDERYQRRSVGISSCDVPPVAKVDSK